MSAITDIPIKGLEEDLLKIQKYASALSNFIIQSDTPITVGLQGEWGTGKTSLMSILSEQLSAENIATSWVNTWEYSLFRGVSETTPAVLRGMLEKLENSCKQKGTWDIGDDASRQVKKVGRFLAGVANQLVAKKTGINIADAVDGDASGAVPAEISEIKADISNIIQRLIDSPGNPYKKVVFFVDDLDRIPPNDAVEVLEALKNIFDIPHCVFVLAIDYEVVVKGLEGKFGPKTEENDREFRSFFDKIIQVPFSMPVGTYSIEHFLLEKFRALGYGISEEDAERYAKVVRLTVGSNPRSLKRYLNSYSLINQVKQIEDESTEPRSNLALFALLGIQISYPHLFRMLTKQPDYTIWDSTFASRESIDLESMKARLAAYGESEYLDEEWEQVLWSICQRDTYLKSRAFDALSLLNFLRSTFADNLADEMEGALEFAAITSVDDDASGKQATIRAGQKTLYDGLAPKIDQMNQAQLNKDGIEAFRTLMSLPFEKAKSDAKYRVSFAKTGTGFYNDEAAAKSDKQLLYVFNPAKRKPGLKFLLKANSGIKEEMQEHILTLLKADSITETKLISETRENPGKPDLLLEADLAEKLGKQPYHELLKHISHRVCEKQELQ